MPVQTAKRAVQQAALGARRAAGLARGLTLACQEVRSDWGPEEIIQRQARAIAMQHQLFGRLVTAPRTAK
ncbi:hypothetical protein Mal64_28380 [Pseudobythopirellula maris]|uniref:Uncharacterized protein n=1 Tax=Pseudobythopirellula maris TaxID=2527991 RepID=A0A5C5ZJG4_9BACT|nr:hypothetical protein [Pseudobythopirellula maris]TWT87300.1 hypothetical protein Mal64_28380 [Pseudobythopirellula maris]